MRKEWLGAVWHLSAIVSVVFSRGGLVGDKIHGVKLVGLAEDLRWLRKILDINYGDLVHLKYFYICPASSAVSDDLIG